MTTTERNLRRTLTGVVTSAKAKQTITVEVERTYKHPKYGKYVSRRKRYMTHDQEGTAGSGDTVEIISTRALSKNKRWRLLRVVTGSELGRAEATEETKSVMEEVTGRGEPAEGSK
jgi:small subunit ribosomal protein S17